MHGSIARLWTDYRLAKSTFEDKIKRAHHDLSPSSNLYAPMINPVARRRHANHNNEGLAWAKEMAQRTGCDTLELGNIGFCICRLVNERASSLSSVNFDQLIRLIEG